MRIPGARRRKLRVSPCPRGASEVVTNDWSLPLPLARVRSQNMGKLWASHTHNNPDYSEQRERMPSVYTDWWNETESLLIVRIVFGSFWYWSFNNVHIYLKSSCYLVLSSFQKPALGLLFPVTLLRLSWHQEEVNTSIIFTWINNTAAVAPGGSVRQNAAQCCQKWRKWRSLSPRKSDEWVSHGRMASSVKQTSVAKMESPSKKNIVEIYTDWANHYLEKTKVRLH